MSSRTASTRAAWESTAASPFDLRHDLTTVQQTYVQQQRLIKIEDDIRGLRADIVTRAEHINIDKAAEARLFELQRQIATNADGVALLRSTKIDKTDFQEQHTDLRHDLEANVTAQTLRFAAVVDRLKRLEDIQLSPHR